MPTYVIKQKQVSNIPQQVQKGSLFQFQFLTAWVSMLQRQGNRDALVGNNTCTGETPQHLADKLQSSGITSTVQEMYVRVQQMGNA